MGWNKSVIRGFDEGWNISSVGLPTATFTEENSSSTGGGTPTLTYGSVGIGTAFATRRVFFAIGAVDTGSNISSATINGSAATVIQNGTGENMQGLITAVVPTGTTMSVAITFTSNNFSRNPSCTWVADDSLILSSTPTTSYNNATSTNTLATSLNTQAGGFTLFYFYPFGVTGTTNISPNDDLLTPDVNFSNRVRGHANGTTARTSNATFNLSATGNLHCALWNFR